MTTALVVPSNSQDVVSTGLGMLFQGDALHDDTWGENANGNFAILEQALCGVFTADLSQAPGNDLSLTLAQARNRILVFVGAIASDAIVDVPAVPRSWIVINQTSGAHNLVIEAAGGTGVVVPQGSKASVFCDGTNVATATTETEPVGVMKDYAGLALPAKYAWANGAALSRTSYPDLLVALTAITMATIGNNQQVLAVATDLTGLNIVGAAIEGIGIPSNTIITAVGGGGSPTITVSNPTQGASNQRSVTIFPWGNGDGSSTFNVPDARQRVTVGPGGMGGAGDPGVLPGASYLNGKIGEATHQLTANELANHGHDLNDPKHAHATTEVPHTHGYKQTNITTGVSGGSFGKANDNNNPATTDGAVTGLTVNQASTGITVVASGGNAAHNNVQPTLVCNKIIRVL